jgi:hypothetical protein
LWGRRPGNHNESAPCGCSEDRNGSRPAQPANCLVNSESQQSEAVEASRPGLIKINEILVLHVLRQGTVWKKRGVTNVKD